ncbi:hypothetical protein RvY_16004 [Ramazzottius varieornatus]|uniref:DRBM domain-containing protein n=1 Tax=Ramazzottius varieornatus TaxID=947166 RepID=A0A1D1VWW8_RAMVA|nr:hypothetical protein RvY_16004 [Ramazzottius varieornatus]
MKRFKYDNDVILAPMVRMGTLPFRLLCLDYGCDIAYSEEIVDTKLLQCRRVENPVFGTIDYVHTDGEIIFRTHPDEAERVVLQIGTAVPEQAAAVAAMMERDIAGLDINMGCPKDYSVKGGMGAALLKNPELIEQILRQCRAVFSKSLTCKIRLLPRMEDTLELVKRIETTGVDALAVHGRTKEERPRHVNNCEAIRIIASTISIPVIANGGSADVHSYEDIEKFRLACGASSVMLARAVQRNPSLFRKEGQLPREQMISDYMKKAIDFDCSYRNTKYAIQQLFGDTSTPRGQQFLATRDFREICEIFHYEKYYDEQIRLRGRDPNDQSLEDRGAIIYASPTEKRPRDQCSEDGLIVSESLDYSPISKRLKRANNTHTPKSRLLEWCVGHGIDSASYEFTYAGRAFCGSVTVGKKTYTSTVPHRSKKDAEHACTVVALKHLIPGFEI